MGRPKKRPESWTGQIGMDVGERRQKVEPEALVLDRVKKTLEKAGVWVKRCTTGTFKTMHGTYVSIGERGDPDLECRLRGGCVFFVETKRGKGGVISDEQHAMVAQLREWGFVAGFARSPEEALTLLREAQEAELRKRAA